MFMPEEVNLENLRENITKRDTLVTQNIKDKALELIGQQNRSEICIYFDNTEECKSYKDVDSAAQAACDLIR